MKSRKKTFRLTATVTVTGRGIAGREDCINAIQEMVDSYADMQTEDDDTEISMTVGKEVAG